jgi:WXXGXW repeat (2 copies)
MSGKHCILLSLLALVLFAIPGAAQAQISVGLSVHIGPPALPVYVQPACPTEGYLWTPGFWAYGDEGYYWVPGTWVQPPRVGVLWTPGYWGWSSGAYLFHAGYWGPHVGFYGGINYGFGYGGVGFAGGAWQGGVYSYNRSVTNVNTTIVHNTYNTTVINNNTTVNRTSFNGGSGGVAAQPTAAEQAAEHENHIAPTPMQTNHEQAARSDKTMLASANHGQPAVAASAKPGVFKGAGVVSAKPVNNSANNNRPSTVNNAASKSMNSNRPATANNAAAKINRPPSTRSNTASSSNKPLSTTSNSTKAAQNATHANTSRPAPSNHSAPPPQHQNAPKSNNKPEHPQKQR